MANNKNRRSRRMARPQRDNSVVVSVHASIAKSTAYVAGSIILAKLVPGLTVTETGFNYGKFEIMSPITVRYQGFAPSSADNIFCCVVDDGAQHTGEYKEPMHYIQSGGFAVHGSRTTTKTFPRSMFTPVVLIGTDLSEATTRLPTLHYAAYAAAFSNEGQAKALLYGDVVVSFRARLSDPVPGVSVGDHWNQSLATLHNARIEVVPPQAEDPPAER